MISERSVRAVYVSEADVHLVKSGVYRLLWRDILLSALNHRYCSRIISMIEC